MNNIKLMFFLLLLPFFLFSQETVNRLALVIGNSNYDKGELKNPVNDARLIASTLDSLGFDVILKENLATRREMLSAIDEFGEKRNQYEIAFIYYAGHGVQINNQNFLLPTKEIYENENHVLDYAVSVQKIMRYLETQSDHLNILVLDACRDNPFESNWQSTRSLKGGGLAKLPAPTGSLIAFSTDSGQTAPDGNGKNSIYSMTLANELKAANISIEQVFKNVRTKVLKLTKGTQRPVEESKLTGVDFYISPTNYSKIIDNAISLRESGKNYDALELITSIINDKKHSAKKYHYSAYLIRTSIYAELKNSVKAISDINNVIQIIEKDNKYETKKDRQNNLNEFYFLKGKINYDFKLFDNAIEDFTYIIKNSYSDDEKKRAIYHRALSYQELGTSKYILAALRETKFKKEVDYLKLAIADYKKVTSDFFDSAQAWFNMSSAYSKLGQHDEALEAINQALKIKPQEINFLIKKASLMAFNFGQTEQALTQIDSIIYLYPNCAQNYALRGLIYHNNGEYEKATIDYNNAENIIVNSLSDELKSTDNEIYCRPPPLKILYFQRSQSHYQAEKYINAILDLNQVIKIDPGFFRAYKERALSYIEISDYAKAFKDIEKAIEIAPEDLLLYTLLYAICKKSNNFFEKGIQYLEKAISLDLVGFYAYSYLADLYFLTDNFQKAVETISLFNDKNSQSSEGYSKLAKLYYDIWYKDIFEKKDLNWSDVEKLKLWQNKNFKSSIKNYKIALSINPNDAETNLSFAYMLNIQLENDEALIYIDRAIDLDPTNFGALSTRSSILFAQKKESKFDAMYDKFDITMNRDEELMTYMRIFQVYQYINRGNEYQNKKDFLKASSILNQYTEKNGNNLYSYLLRSIINLLLEDFNEAILNISQSIAVFGMDSFTDGEMRAFKELNIFEKNGNQINIVDLYFTRIFINMKIGNRMNGTCKDMKTIINLIESNKSLDVEYSNFFERKLSYQDALEIKKMCDEEGY